MVRIQKDLSWFRKAAVLYSVEKCLETISLCRFYTRLSTTTMTKKNIWSSGETQKYLNLCRKATLRFRKKRQPFHKQKGTCIHFRNFYFNTCIIPRKNTLPSFGWSLRDNWKEPLGGSYCIYYYREYPPPLKLRVINFAGIPVYGEPSLSNFIAWLEYERWHNSQAAFRLGARARCPRTILDGH